MTAQKARFIAAFRNAGTIRKACDRTKLHRADVYDWLEDDAFAQAYDLAWDDFIDSILDTLISLATGRYRGKIKPHVTAILAMLNAFHDDFKTMGKEALESKLSQAVLVIAEIAKKYVPPPDQPKFLEECAVASADASLGLRRKRSRE